MPSLDGKLATTTEPKNPHDKYTVKILKNSKVVGHIPKDLSKFVRQHYYAEELWNAWLSQKEKTSLKMGWHPM